MIKIYENVINNRLCLADSMEEAFVLNYLSIALNEATSYLENKKEEFNKIIERTSTDDFLALDIENKKLIMNMVLAESTLMYDCFDEEDEE